MRTLSALFACAAIACSASPALAEDSGRNWQVKLLASTALPDGKIDKVDTDVIGLPADLQTKASDNVVPTLAIEYFFAPHYHPVFPWHHVPGYMAVLGLVASVALVALAKGAGTLFLQRPEDADDRD